MYHYIFSSLRKNIAYKVIIPLGYLLIKKSLTYRFNCLDYLKWYLLYNFFEIIDLIVLKFYFGSIKLNWIGSFEICIFFNYLKLKTD